MRSCHRRRGSSTKRQSEGSEYRVQPWPQKRAPKTGALTLGDEMAKWTSVGWRSEREKAGLPGCIEQQMCEWSAWKWRACLRHAHRAAEDLLALRSPSRGSSNRVPENFLQQRPTSYTPSEEFYVTTYRSLSCMSHCAESLPRFVAN